MRTISALLALVVTATLAVAEPPNWPQWRGPAGDGRSEETGWSPRALDGGAKVAWTAQIGSGYSSPVIWDGRLYAIGSPDLSRVLVTCLDAMTGRVLWQQSLDLGVGAEDPMSTPAVDGDHVYGLLPNAVAFCLRTADGSLTWKTRLGLKGDIKTMQISHGLGTSPIVDGELLIINTNKSGIALDKASGKPAWTSPIVWGSAPYATPVIRVLNGRRTALMIGPTALNAVATDTGEVLWSLPHADKAQTVVDPLADGDLLFFPTSTACQVVEVGKDGPHQVWSGDTLRGGLASGVAMDGYLYGSDWEPNTMSSLDAYRLQNDEHPFRCIDMRTGQVAWSRSMKLVSLAQAGSRLIMLDAYGHLSIVEASPRGLETLGSADVLAGTSRPRLFLAPPVPWNGRVYCRNYAGDLLCVDLGAATR